MPTYEYLCQSCGNRFEAFQHITDDPLTECPKCGGHIRRVLFPAGIVFKGSGFYKTDSTHASAASVPPAEAPAASESTPAKTESTSDSSAAASTSTPAKSTDSAPAKSAS
jgi:putative FmdB family regulatory protein